MFLWLLLRAMVAVIVSCSLLMMTWWCILTYIEAHLLPIFLSACASSMLVLGALNWWVKVRTGKVMLFMSMQILTAASVTSVSFVYGEAFWLSFSSGLCLGCLCSSIATVASTAEHSTGAAISTSVRGQKIGIGQSEHAEHKIWMENLRAGQIHRSMCAICLDDFSVGQHVLEIASCGHLFHKDCLIQWEGDCPYRCPRPGASNV
eukprot:TRINITY_DN8935_c0_g1_i1.p1 TRINITY_DN8935_c0_g1~~TRINITY_DN8935_c0_g1_i1.p1  ORF type:complete len:241 (-),score=21.94 TRINITY_DN8935_c0_g1_i1:247-861(-)